MTETTGSARVVESLNWAAASRDDAVVAAALLAGADLDGLYGLGHAQIVDLLFCWLREIGVLDLLSQLEGVGMERQMIPFETFVILYLLRCLARVPSQNALPDLLFCDEALMRRLGFNAHPVRPESAGCRTPAGTPSQSPLGPRDPHQEHPEAPSRHFAHRRGGHSRPPVGPGL
ncbi:MAG: hypothetical protein Q8P31_10960 [Bacillota bacterium]|nr:hypothetical protein [Bacillota bacterium]